MAEQQGAHLKTVTTNPKLNIYVDVTETKGDSLITGISLLSPDSVLLADNRKKMVYIGYHRSRNIKCLRLDSKPWDVATLLNNKAATTLPDENAIQIFSTQIPMSLTRRIPTSTTCYGIDATEEIICVSLVHPGRVEVFTYSGTIVNTIMKVVDGSSLFSLPYYLRVGTENCKIVFYVTDYNFNKLFKMSLKSEVIFTYTHDGIARPRGLDVTDVGNILVCGSENDTVQVVNPDGTFDRNRFGEEDGIKKPYAVCYNTHNNIVYVSCGDRPNRVRGYQLY